MSLEDRATAMWEQVQDALPTIGEALGALVGLYIVAWLLRRALIAGLKRTRLDTATDTRLARLLAAIKPGLSPSRAIAGIVFLFIMLAAWMVSLDILGVPGVRDMLGALLAFAPRLAGAIFIVTVGAFIAAAAGRVVHALLQELRSPLARLLGTFTEIFLLVVVLAVALKPLGADTTILTANLTILIGAVLGLVVFLLAWAMRRPAEQIIANYYVRRIVVVGDVIDISGVQGTVVGFAPIGVVIRHGMTDELVPALRILDGLRKQVAVDATSAPPQAEEPEA